MNDQNPNQPSKESKSHEEKPDGTKVDTSTKETAGTPAKVETEKTVTQPAK